MEGNRTSVLQQKVVEEREEEEREKEEGERLSLGYEERKERH